MRIVLLGDSHLARVQRRLSQLTGSDDRSTPILNAAVGGADVLDLAAQATRAAIGPDDRVAVSIGTNDAAPWKQVDLSEGVARLGEFLATLRAERLVYLAPPGVDEARLGREHDRTSETMAQYAATYAAAFTAVGATIVDTPALLAPLGAEAFAEDGVHLRGSAYALILPALRSALCS